MKKLKITSLLFLVSVSAVSHPQTFSYGYVTGQPCGVSESGDLTEISLDGAAFGPDSNSYGLTGSVQLQLLITGVVSTDAPVVIGTGTFQPIEYTFAQAYNREAGGSAYGYGSVDKAISVAAIGTGLGSEGDYEFPIITIQGAALKFERTPNTNIWTCVYNLPTFTLTAEGALTHPTPNFKDDQGEGYASVTLASGRLITKNFTVIVD